MSKFLTKRFTGGSFLERNTPNMVGGVDWVPTTAGEQDQELYQKWQRTKNPQDLQKLMNAIDPVIKKSTSALTGNISQGVLAQQGKLLAIKALETYDPSRGTSISTHVTNALKPLRRTVYTYTNSARIPEHLALKVNGFNNLKEELTVVLGRPPSVDELQEKTGYSGKELHKLDTYQRKNLIESIGVDRESITLNNEEYSLDALYFSLTPPEKKLFEYTTDYLGPALKTEDILDRLNITQGQLSYQKKNLAIKIMKLREKLG